MYTIIVPTYQSNVLKECHSKIGHEQLHEAHKEHNAFDVSDHLFLEVLRRLVRRPNDLEGILAHRSSG